MTPREREIRIRLRSDFEYYAPRCLKIRTKAGRVDPFRLNVAQAYLHSQIEAQKAKTGKVRALVLKGRQQGCSTYTEGRYFHALTHRRGIRAFILTHMDDATNNLFGMAKRFYEHCPEIVRPSQRASNAKEFIFDKLDSGYKVGTAGSKGYVRHDGPSGAEIRSSFSTARKSRTGRTHKRTLQVPCRPYRMNRELR